MNLENLQALLRFNLGDNQLGGEKDDMDFITSLTNCSNLYFLARYWVKKNSRKKPPSVSSIGEHFLEVTYAEILKATDDFSSANLIGMGSFGSVYKGVLDQIGLTVAIKVLKLQQRSASKSFIAECKALKSIQHRNIVKILTVCSSIDFRGNDFKALVFEYMQNGSLDTWLHKDENEQHHLRCLNFIQRLNVAIDVANALDYLHHHCEDPVVHCDLKPSNILLNEDMVAHVGDFGLARIFYKDGSNCSQAQSSSVWIKGSIGYVVPEYGIGGEVSMRHPQRVIALNLRSQNLAGYLLPHIGNLSFLRIIELTNNSFQGQIPPEIGRLRRLRYLHMGNNSFNGEIPAHYCLKKSSKKSPILTSMGERFLEVTYAELLKATDGFSSANLIGVGSFGFVYKGFLEQVGLTAAIKVVKLQQQRASKSFIAECKALRSIRHRNIVKILSICSSIDFTNNDFKALVFEYMPNGSLDTWLHPNEEQHNSTCLNFIQRLNVAIDVASALDYLHHYCEAPVVHCDLKPSNVLLDEDMVAQVGDFGLARAFSKDVSNCSHTQSSSIGIKGSIGYVAPEYGMGGDVSTYGDVYSYGILLLEMFMGKRPTDDIFKDNLNLHQLAKMAFPDRVTEIIDHRLLLEGNENISSNEDYNEMRSRINECFLSLVRIGEMLGLPYLPTFVQSKSNVHAMLSGVNYASAAGGILDEIGQHVVHGSYQVPAMFVFGDSLVDNGNNNYLYSLAKANYFPYGIDFYQGPSGRFSNGKTAVDMRVRCWDFHIFQPLYKAKLIWTLFLQALHSVGLRKFFLAGLGPLGCVPNQLALNQTPPGQCVSSVNEIVGLFNVGLKSLVDQLNGNHTGAIFLYGNAYGAIVDILNNPSSPSTILFYFVGTDIQRHV
ncbi:hypothetical protein AAC387_Pa04g0993 [Persea americana]